METNALGVLQTGMKVSDTCTDACDTAVLNYAHVEPSLQDFVTVMNWMSKHTHQVNVDAGWWTDLSTGLKKERNVGELLMLCVSEIAEAMEGHRKNLMDDKLPHRKMFEVELSDLLIRVFDIAGAYDLDLGNAIVEKMAFNKSREDHKLENRMKEGGKKY